MSSVSGHLIAYARKTDFLFQNSKIEILSVYGYNKLASIYFRNE